MGIPSNALASFSEFDYNDTLRKLDVINAKYSGNVIADVMPLSKMSSKETINIINPDNIIELNSWEELDDLMSKMNDYVNMNNVTKIAITPDGRSRLTRATEYEDHHTREWQDWAWWNYALLTWETLIWKSLTITYKYKFNSRGEAEFTSVKSVDSSKFSFTS